MLQISRLKTHRSWEDWVVFGLGAALLMSPALDPAHSSGALINAIVVGFLVLCLAMSELLLIERWEERALMVLALWLIASPTVLDYYGHGSLWIWHSVIGAGLAVMAALELWQDNDLPKSTT